jgi:hypothetical protein
MDDLRFQAEAHPYREHPFPAAERRNPVGRACRDELAAHRLDIDASGASGDAIRQGLRSLPMPAERRMTLQLRRNPGDGAARKLAVRAACRRALAPLLRELCKQDAVRFAA